MNISVFLFFFLVENSLSNLFQHFEVYKIYFLIEICFCRFYKDEESAVYTTSTITHSIIHILFVSSGPNGSAPPSYPVAPKIEPARPRPQPVLPLAPVAPPANQPQAPGTSAGTPKSESKPSSSSKDSKSGDKTEKTKDSKGKKTDKSGGKVPGKELTEKEKLKKEKAKKERHEKKKKEEKLKLEKEKKLKAKEEKKLKGKAPAQPVASVTIDEEAVASNQAAMNPKVQQVAMNPMVNQAVSKNPIARNPVASPPPYQEEAFSKVGQNVRSPNVQNQPVASQGGFTSSWDQVAEHRQNMQREVKTFSSPAKNLRALGNQSQSDGKPINSLYMTSNNSPRNNNPAGAGAGRSGSYSPPSDYSGEESDTEA